MLYETSQLFDQKTILTLNSGLAYSILHILRKQSDYPTNISKTLGSSPQSISNFVRELRKLGIVSRGERTQAQQYRINYDGLYSLFAHIFEKVDALKEEEYRGNEKRSVEAKATSKKEENFERKMEKKAIHIIKTNAFFKKVFVTYCKEYLLLREQSSLYDFLYNDFCDGFNPRVFNDLLLMHDLEKSEDDNDMFKAFAGLLTLRMSMKSYKRRYLSTAFLIAKGILPPTEK